ncbi:MAG: LacI family DNA-binding transcriptional regulator [Streptosporangiales bacterium]|nr:LacI family DNA-binding transcriptional regulator [Streptosporangiales bacterium]
MRPRMSDVAKLAGVSAKTVSNVVNGYEHVSPEMRAKVLAAITELNYVPNVSARSLRTGRTKVIALALPDLAVPYFGELARHITRAAEEHDFTILIDQTDGLVDRERQIASGLRDNVIDGLIFSPLALGAEEIAAASSETPMVLLGEREHPATTDHVAFDNIAAARLATGHLVRLGRTRIAAIGSQVERRVGTGALRLEGHQSALKDAGLPVDDQLVVPTRRLHRMEGVRAMDELLDLPEPPDAVVCFNDLVALGALYTLRRRGLRVPDDVAVVGFDDIEESTYSNPTLTTISPDKERIATTAIDLLVRRLAGKRGTDSREVLVDFQLVQRESTQLR